MLPACSPWPSGVPWLLALRLVWGPAVVGSPIGVVRMTPIYGQPTQAGPFYPAVKHLSFELAASLQPVPAARAPWWFFSGLKAGHGLA
jgi:hypothetical protein